MLKISCQASSVLLIRRERWWRCLIILHLFFYSSKSFCKFWILVKNRRRRWCVVIIGRLCGAETEKRGRRRRAVVFYSFLCRGTWGRLPGENHRMKNIGLTNLPHTLGMAVFWCLFKSDPVVGVLEIAQLPCHCFSSNLGGRQGIINHWSFHPHS